MSTAQDIFFNIRPPADSSEDPAYQVLTHATSAAASNYDWYGALGANAPKGSVMLLVEASGSDAFVRFKKTSTTAATTTTNGLIVKAGVPGRIFYVNPLRHGVIDSMATGTGSIQVQVASPIGERNIV